LGVHISFSKLPVDQIPNVPDHVHSKPTPHDHSADIFIVRELFIHPLLDARRTFLCGVVVHGRNGLGAGDRKLREPPNNFFDFVPKPLMDWDRRSNLDGSWRENRSNNGRKSDRLRQFR
jgi:hypothetical protein